MEKSQMTEQEFEQMAEHLRPRLMQMGREFFGSDTEAEEVVQETWLRAWNVRERVELTDAYILRIARNCCVSMWRGQRAQVELADEHSAVTEVTPQEEVEDRENSEWLQSRLQRLPKAEREVWNLFYDEGLTLEEIAEERGTSVATIRKTISNVRNRLRKDIRRHFIGLRHLLLFVLIALSTAAAFLIGLGRIGITGIPAIGAMVEEGNVFFSPVCASTMAFATLCLARLWHGFNCRGKEHIFRLGLFSNWFTIGAFVLGAALLHCILRLRFFSAAFGVALLNPHLLLIVWILSFLPTLIIQIVKAFQTK